MNKKKENILFPLRYSNFAVLAHKINKGYENKDDLDIRFLEFEKIIENKIRGEIEKAKKEIYLEFEKKFNDITLENSWISINKDHFQK